MRVPSNSHLSIALFLIAIALAVLIATHKTHIATDTSLNHNDDTVAKYIDEVEQQDILERDQREHAAKLAKLAKAKRDSVECQFWMQQKQKKSTDPRLNDKITQFCELPLEQSTASLPSAKEE